MSPKPWRRARSGISGCVERQEDPHTAAYIVEAGDTRCLVRQSQEYSGPLGERHFAKKDEGSACCGARLPVGGGCRYGHNRRGAAVRAEPPPGVSGYLGK
eukprot:COSAG01_NODE_2111_length_8407_cov_2.098700_6_plen_100_part_00